jgi:hypothetical protein
MLALWDRRDLVTLPTDQPVQAFSCTVVTMAVVQHYERIIAPSIRERAGEGLSRDGIVEPVRWLGPLGSAQSNTRAQHREKHDLTHAG